MGYKKDIIKGFSWLGSFRIVTRILSFIRTAITARLLTPSQVGVFGIATIVLSLMEIVTETGINIFLIQKKDSIDSYISTAWITSILRGILIALVILIAAPFVADFFNVNDSLYILRLIALVPFMRGFINPSVVKFTKDLSFHKEFYYRTSVFLVETVVSIWLLYVNPSPLSLVWGLIFGAAFEVIISFGIAKPLPEFTFEMHRFQEVLHRGKWLTLTGIFSYLYHNADNIVVGKLLGTATLGLYQMAYKISSLPISEGSDLVSSIMFPVMVKMSDDTERLKRAYLKSVLLISAMVLPLCFVFFFFPELIVRILLGDQWLASAAVLQVLAVFGSLRAISMAAVNPFYALGKQEYVTRITLVSLLGMGITIYPFIQWWGILGAGIAVTFGAIVALPVILYYVYKVFYSASKS